MPSVPGVWSGRVYWVIPPWEEDTILPHRWMLVRTDDERDDRLECARCELEPEDTSWRCRASSADVARKVTG